MGKSTAMELIRSMWLGETPFQTPGQELVRELRSQIADSHGDGRRMRYLDSDAEFRFSLRLPTSDAGSNIGTSALLATWNATT